MVRVTGEGAYPAAKLELAPDELTALPLPQYQYLCTSLSLSSAEIMVRIAGERDSLAAKPELAVDERTPPPLQVSLYVLLS